MPPFFLPDQKQLGTGQARGHGVEQVVGEVLGLGQENHRRIKRALRHVHAELAALGEACVERGLVTGMPAPAVGIG